MKNQTNILKGSETPVKFSKTDTSLLAQRESVGANTPSVQATPGPWRIDCMSAERGLEIKGANGNTVIVEDDYFTFPDEMLCKDSVAEELAANARLIAAAPELFEACKEVEADLLAFNVEDVNVLNVERVGELRGMLLAAIAKAQGLSPDTASSNV